MPYPNSPIREAVFDIKFKGVKLEVIEDLGGIFTLVDKVFPIKKEKFQLTGTFEVKNDKGVSGLDSKQIGYVFLTEDNSRQLHVQPLRLTLNVLRPYQSWEEHFPVFMQVLNFYVEKFNPTEIERIGLRYINRIKLPLPIEHFEDYIVSMPPIPEPLPKLFNNFFMQISTPCNEENIMQTNIIQTMEGIFDGKLPFIIDIDIFQSNSKLPIQFGDLKRHFSDMREMKNNIFESLITDKTRKLFS